MSNWGSKKARDVLKTLLRLGWVVTSSKGSHKTLERFGVKHTFAHHDGEEISSVMMAKIGKKLGLKPEDF